MPDAPGSKALVHAPLHTKPALFIITIMVLLTTGTGCGIFSVNTVKNDPLSDRPIPKQTLASQSVTVSDLSDEIFIGIALSGGGSRAANFSAAVMLELEHIGILNKATAISSVSGSSLPAAYYGLYKSNTKHWNEHEVRKRLRKNFEGSWIARWFLPHNALLYWFSNYNRSDIMKEVLDSTLYDEKTFADMGVGRPRILVNATTLSDGNRFVFSQERFNKIGSRIDTYPVANAVMASSAFPGAFHDMTLKNYSLTDGENYEHVLDGGPSDNLGITTLLEMVQQLYRAEKKPKGCFLFVVDAYPYPENPAHTHELDTRKFFDFIFDTNVAASSDALLMARRLDLMSDLNVDVSADDSIEPFQPNSGENEIWPDQDDVKFRVECAVWHLSLQRLLSPDFAGKATGSDAFLKQDIKEVATVVNAIPTRYRLLGKAPDGKTELTSETLQDYLFKSAGYLIRLDEDKDGTLILKHVCEWFAARGMSDLQCGQ